VSDESAAVLSAPAAAPAAAADEDDVNNDDDDDDDGLFRQSRLLVRLTVSATIPFTYSALSDAAAHRTGGGK